MEEAQALIRVIVQQPALPDYRVPFFRELAARPGIELHVHYGDANKTLVNAEAVGFENRCFPMWIKRIGGRSIKWHAAQWDGAKKSRCDVLVLSWDAQYISLVPALIRARINGIKTILWGHGYSKQESWLRKAIRDTVGRLADGLLFYDKVAANSFLAAGWSESRIHVAPNSLDQFEIQQAKAYWLEHDDRLKSFQKDKGLADRKNIIYIGRIYAENRLDVLISALQQVKRNHSDVQLLVIGKGSEEEHNLRKLAEYLNVADSVKWLGAVHNEKKIAPYMLSSRLFCYPANIGLSIMHAMGYGLPVITGDDIPSHNPEIHVLCNGENGYLFRHLDVNDLSDKISDLLSDSAKACKMGSNGSNSVLTDFTVQKMADGFLRAINA